MTLPDGQINLDTSGYGTRGFTFSILGPDPMGGGEPPRRSQDENPIFTRDQAGNLFESGVVYRFEGQHPEYMDPAELVRVIFDEFGGYVVLTPNENGDGSGSGSGNNNLPPVDLIGAVDGSPLVLQQLINGSFKVVAGVIARTLRQLTDLSSLSDLKYVFIKLLGEEPIVLQGSLEKGDANVFFDHTGTSTSGLVFRTLSKAFRGFFGLDTDDKLFFLQGSKEVFEFDKQQSNFFMDLLAGISTHAVFNRFSSVSMPVAGDYDSALVPEYDTVRGRWDYKKTTLAELEKRSWATVNKAQRAAELQPYLNGEVASSKRLVLDVYCFEEEYDDSTTLTEQLYFITPDMIGTPQAHPFNRDGNLIWADLKDYNNKADEVMDLSFPSPTTFQIDYPEGVSDYAGGKLLLKI